MLTGQLSLCHSTFYRPKGGRLVSRVGKGESGRKGREWWVANDLGFSKCMGERKTLVPRNQKGMWEKRNSSQEDKVQSTTPPPWGAVKSIHRNGALVETNDPGKKRGKEHKLRLGWTCGSEEARIIKSEAPVAIHETIPADWGARPRMSKLREGVWRVQWFWALECHYHEGTGGLKKRFFY